MAEAFAWQLGASWNYRKFAANLRLSYTDVNNSVISDVTYIGDHMFLSRSVNARDNRVFRSDLRMKLSGVAGFGANANLSLARFHSAGEDWSHNLTSFSAMINLWWNHGPFTLSYGRSILPGKYLSGHMVARNENYDELQFEYRPDSHWTIGASWMYMFDRKGTRYPSWDYSRVNPSYTDRYISDNSNMVVLSVSYNADFGSIFRTGRRSLENSDSSSSILKM